METEQKICLVIDISTKNRELAIVRKAQHIVHNLSVMAKHRKRIVFERLGGKRGSHFISTYGKWVMVFNLEESARCESKSSMHFYDLNADMKTLEGFLDEPKDVLEDIEQARNDYRKLFDPRIHDIVRLVSGIPS